MKEKKRRLGVLDAALILFFLLCAVSLLLRWMQFQKKNDEGLSIYQIHAEVTGVLPITAELLHEGDTLYTPAGDIYGRIITIERVPAKIKLADQGGIYNAAYPIEEKCDLLVKIELRGTQKGQLLLQNGSRAVLVGESYRLCSSLSSLEYRIIAVFLD